MVEDQIFKKALFMFKNFETNSLLNKSYLVIFYARQKLGMKKIVY